MQKEPGVELFTVFFSFHFKYKTMYKVYTISITMCNIPQSELRTIHQVINNLTINSDLQYINTFSKILLSR